MEVAQEIGISQAQVSRLEKNELLASPTVQTIGVSILSFNNLFAEIVAVYLVLGIGIGIVGSSISMKKYLEVI